MLRSKWLLSLPAVLIGAALLWYLWMIASAKLEWGGGSPDQQTLGRVHNVKQRAMEQYCTGVVGTAQGTWLVGRLEGGAEDLELPAEAIDLNAVVYGKPAEGEGQEPEESGAFFGFGMRRDKQTSYISRLDAHGQFQVVAHVNEAACLVASPDGATLFLLTGLDRPKGSAQNALDQTVILRSDDQGKSWKWLPQGLFPKANMVAWNLNPYFHGQDEIWAWGSPQARDSESGEGDSAPLSTGVFYSVDRGASSREIFTGTPLLVDAEYARGKRPEITEWNNDSGPDGESKTHVTQLDAQRAVIWVSQRFWGRDPQQEDRNLFFNVTTRAQLQRDAGQWRVASVQRDDGLFIDELVESPDGKVVGLIDQGGQGQAVIGRLDPQTLSWQSLSELPSVFSPLPSYSMLRERNFWVGRNTLVINTSSRHHPPRWLYGGREATISADGVFYSKDWGRSWHQLAMDGYLGALGFQGAQDRVFWAKGNWYDSRDLGVYSYGLQ